MLIRQNSKHIALHFIMAQTKLAFHFNKNLKTVKIKFLLLKNLTLGVNRRRISSDEYADTIILAISLY